MSCHRNWISRESCANLTVSLCLCVKKKKKPPDLHARCCYDNEQFSQFLFLKLPSYLLTLSLSAYISSSSLGPVHTVLLTHVGHEGKTSSSIDFHFLFFFIVLGGFGNTQRKKSKHKHNKGFLQIHMHLEQQDFILAHTAAAHPASMAS